MLLDRYQPFFGESPRSGESLGTESPEKRGFANTRCLKPPMFPHFSKFCWYPPVSSNVAIGKSLVKMEAFNRTPTGKSSIHGWIFDDHPTSLAFHFLCPANSSPVARPISSRHPSAPLLQWDSWCTPRSARAGSGNVPTLGSLNSLLWKPWPIYIIYRWFTLIYRTGSPMAVFARTPSLSQPAPCAWERSCNRSPGKANLILRESHWMGGRLWPRHRRKPGHKLVMSVMSPSKKLRETTRRQGSLHWNSL